MFLFYNRHYYRSDSNADYFCVLVATNISNKQLKFKSMNENGVLVFPDAGARATSSIDPNLMLALQNGGGFGNNGAWIWFLFMWMMWQNGGFGNYRNNGAGFADIAAQMNGDTGRDFIIQAMNGRADALAQLAQITNSSVETVKGGISMIQSAIQNVTGQIGITSLQTQNAVALSNAQISRQICECCCENRLAIANQTSALQAQMAANQAATQLQFAQGQAADQLAVCQQTNTLTNQSERNTNLLLNAIANQSTMITKEFCELKERELQNKIDSLTADNALLRSNMNTNMQTQQFAAMLAPIQAELASIKAAQPNTITLPQTQYAVVPSWAANVGSDFIASYWANRLSSATQSTTTTTTPATGA